MKKSLLFSFGLASVFTAATIFGSGCKPEPKVNVYPKWPLTEADSALWVGQQVAKKMGLPNSGDAATFLAKYAKEQHDKTGISYLKLYSAPVVYQPPVLENQ